MIEATAIAPNRSLLRPPPEVATLGLRAMKQVGSTNGVLRPGARRLIEAAQRMFLGVNVALDQLVPIDPSTLAAALPEPLREQFVRGMVVLSLTDGPPTAETAATIRSFATALGADQPAIDTVEQFAEGHLLLGTVDYHRRSNIRGMIEQEIEARGVFRGLKSFLRLRGFAEDPEVAAPFVALGELPRGTLGRAMFDHYRSFGFAFPGERGGFPEAGFYHDVTHVLAGYGTDPLGELQVGAITAGFRGKDPLYVAMLPLLVFCAEINVTPIPHEHAEDLFSQPGVAERFIAAYERGARVTVDLSDHRDFWPYMSRSLEDVRRELNITSLDFATA